MTNADRIAALLEAHTLDALTFQDSEFTPPPIAWCACGWHGGHVEGPSVGWAAHVASVLAHAGVLDTQGLSDADVDDAAQEFGHRTACDVWWDSTESFKSALRRLASGETV